MADEQIISKLATKNVFSVQTEDRLEELMGELSLTDWDVVALTETWREMREEIFELPGGHLFFGAGGTKGER